MAGIVGLFPPCGGHCPQEPAAFNALLAVECGLKAVWLKRQCRGLFNQVDITDTGHDLRRILKNLNIGTSLLLPENLSLAPINPNIPRNGDISIRHQAWRYGGECIEPTDQQCEQQLLEVLDWIKGELK